MLYPLTIGTEAQFGALRSALIDLGFAESAVCERTGIDSIYKFKTLVEQRKKGQDLADSLDLLIHLLMDGMAFEEPVLRKYLSADMVANLEGLGIVVRDPDDSRLCLVSAFLYPVAGVYIASDRTFRADPNDRKLPEDVVYAAITGNTGRFLSILPEDPCEDFLDLCAGTGVAAIVAGARYAARAWATDLGPRCVHFAEFNRLLNGLPNVTSAQGDLYEAIGDRTFDRISAHPPYVPAKSREFLFRDGGQDGEQILRRIVEGLPRHLRARGRFYCQTFATDREDSTVEQRVREWLGEAQSKFDVCLLDSEFQSRPANLLRAVSKAKGRLGTLSDTARLLEELKVTGLFYGTIVIHRKAESRPAATGRVRKAEQARTETVEWFWRWHAAAAVPDFTERLLQSRPVPSPSFKLQVTHTPQAQGLAPSEFLLRAHSPFVSEASVEPWLAVVTGHCDGKRTVRQIFLDMKEQEVISADMSEVEFSGFMRILLSSGFLETEDWKLPRLPEARTTEPEAASSDGLTD